MNDYTKIPNRKDNNKKTTLSHIMVFIVLIVYLAIIFGSLILIAYSVKTGLEYSSLYIALLSYSGTCGTSTIVVYTVKAMKENEIKIANSRYHMKLEMAKEICKALANKTISNESIMLLKVLISDDTGAAETGTVQLQDIPIFNIPKSDEGLG